MAAAGDAFEKLVEVMQTLRSPGGCPWDREQTLESLTHFVLEEAYEVVDAIERGDTEALKEEVGDHVFEGVFLAQVAAEDGLFTVADSLRTTVEKLVRRHPHVFQDDGRLHDAASKERAPSAQAAWSRCVRCCCTHRRSRRATLAGGSCTSSTRPRLASGRGSISRSDE